MRARGDVTHWSEQPFPESILVIKYLNVDVSYFHYILRMNSVSFIYILVLFINFII